MCGTVQMGIDSFYDCLFSLLARLQKVLEEDFPVRSICGHHARHFLVDLHRHLPCKYYSQSELYVSAFHILSLLPLHWLYVIVLAIPFPRLMSFFIFFCNFFYSSVLHVAFLVFPLLQSSHNTGRCFW